MKHLTASRAGKRLIPLGLAVTTLAIAAPLSAVAGNSSSAGTIRVVGSGVRAASSSKDVPFTFSIDAATPASANGVYGTFSGSFPHDPYFRKHDSAAGSFAIFKGVVACLRVNGSRATIGGVITSGFGYDSVHGGDGFSTLQLDLTGDWFIITGHDPAGGKSTATVGYTDWGDRTYFTTAGYHYTSFASMCNHPNTDLGTNQFPLVTGEFNIRH